MVCLSHSSNIMPGIAPLMNVSFWERCDFHVSFSGRDTSGNDWNRPSGSSMVDMGISSIIMKSPSPKCLHDILGHDHIQRHPLFIRYFTKSCPCYWTGPYYRFRRYCLIPWGFHRTLILQRVRLANRGRLLLRPPGPVPFGTCICSNVETIHSLTCNVYGPFECRTCLGTSILLVSTYISFFLILRRLMAFLSLSLFDMAGCAPRMNVLSWGSGEFPVSNSNRDILWWNACNRHSGSFMVDTGILFSNMKSLSHECSMTFWPLTSYSDFPTDKTVHQFSWPWYRTWPFDLFTETIKYAKCSANSTELLRHSFQGLFLSFRRTCPMEFPIHFSTVIYMYMICKLMRDKGFDILFPFVGCSRSAFGIENIILRLSLELSILCWAPL